MQEHEKTKTTAAPGEGDEGSAPATTEASGDEPATSQSAPAMVPPGSGGPPPGFGGPGFMPPAGNL